MLIRQKDRKETKTKTIQQGKITR